MPLFRCVCSYSLQMLLQTPCSMTSQWYSHDVPCHRKSHRATQCPTISNPRMAKVAANLYARSSTVSIRSRKPDHGTHLPSIRSPRRHRPMAPVSSPSCQEATSLYSQTRRGGGKASHSPVLRHPQQHLSYSQSQGSHGSIQESERPWSMRGSAFEGTY